MNPVQHFLILGVRFYRWVLSPAKVALFGPLGRCRYTPTCSEYALEAVQRHGVFGGAWLALKRLGRCHPWGGCGHDPVPKSVFGKCLWSATGPRSQRAEGGIGECCDRGPVVVRRACGVFQTRSKVVMTTKPRDAGLGIRGAAGAAEMPDRG